MKQRRMITKGRLVEIIREEVEQVRNSKLSHLSDKDKKNRKNKQREKQRDMDFIKWGDREGLLRQLAKGIAEDNFNFDKDGHFTSKEDATCVSSYFKDGRRKRKSGSLTNPPETGRGRQKDSHGRFRCHDNAKLWEEDDDGFVRVKKSSLKDLIANEIMKLFDEYAEEVESRNVVMEDDKSEKMMAICKKKYGLKTFREFLNIINNFEKAKKGSLFKADKD